MAKEKEESNVLEILKPFYNYRNRPPKVQWHSDNPSKVQEGPLDARSPQELMDKYGMYKDPSALKEPTPFYADLTAFDDYAESLNKVRDIREKFSELDIDIRAKFNHNPEEFCNYVMSKDFNIEEIMPKAMYETYMKRKKYAEQQQAIEDYKKTDEYKKEQEEYAQRQAYEKARYEEWKSQFGGSKK